MKRLSIPFFVFLFLILSCKEKKAETLSNPHISFTKEGELRIFTNDSLIIDLDIEIADNDYERETGLMHRQTMNNDHGMLFIQEEFKVQRFYMKNTQIPLDLIFIDPQMKVVSFQKNAEPFNESSLSSQVPAQYVLEVNAGLADQWSLAVGDSIAYTKNP